LSQQCGDRLDVAVPGGLALEWVHGPGMIVTPELGVMAYKQENAGEKAHGAASYHGLAAYVTTATYGASIVAVSWPIHPSRTDGQSDGGGRAYGVEPTAGVFLQEQGDIEPHKRPPPQCLRIPDNDEKFISST